MRIAHVLHRFDYGGLENGLVNIVNRLDDGFEHHIIALTTVGGIAQRVQNKSVKISSIGKRPGKDLAAYWRLGRLLREISPDVVHTRNIGTMDVGVVARLVGTRRLVHGEHGWDMDDLHGVHPRFRRRRILLAPLFDRIVCVSKELSSWLVDDVGLPERKIVHICNGVDTARFSPATSERTAKSGLTIGSVLRFSDVKNPLLLVDAFIDVYSRHSARAIRLCMIGAGPLLDEARKRLGSAVPESAYWLPGVRDDIPELMRQMDIFVLPSRKEGISNTLLEAMASGLPVIAADTGGNPELVVNDRTGRLFEEGDAGALAAALEAYVLDADLMRQHGAAGRERAEACFSLDTMCEGYRRLYMDLGA